MYFSNVQAFDTIEVPKIPKGKSKDPDDQQKEDERDRERQERIEKKRKQDAEERVKKRDPEAEPDKQTRSFFEHGEDGGIQDDDPYGLPMPPGEKVTRAEQRPQPWDSFELYALMLS